MTERRMAAPLFRRVVLGLHDTSCAEQDLEAAIALARALESELLAVFVEDRPVLEWSAAPLSRHLTASAGIAQPVTADRLSAALELAAARLRTRLMQAAGRLGVAAAFQVERSGAPGLIASGPIASRLTASRPSASDPSASDPSASDPSASDPSASGAGPQDLLAVVEPSDPMARFSYPFAGLLRSLATATAPVLYVPHGTRPRHGPVVALGTAGTSEGRRIAAAIAARLGAPLVSRGDGRQLDLQAIDRALAGLDECLLVLDRPALPGGTAILLAEIAARRAVPVLVAGQGDRPPSTETG